MTSEDFYEDDEPVADIVEAFERGQKFETRPPGHGFNRYCDPFRRMAGTHLAAPRLARDGLALSTRAASRNAPMHMRVEQADDPSAASPGPDRRQDGG
ncbi:MAG: hypothetical protein ACRDTF_24450 [Pseudonocardiaceae bacterium]